MLEILYIFIILELTILYHVYLGDCCNCNGAINNDLNGEYLRRMEGILQTFYWCSSMLEKHANEYHCPSHGAKMVQAYCASFFCFLSLCDTAA